VSTEAAILLAMTFSLPPTASAPTDSAPPVLGFEHATAVEVMTAVDHPLLSRALAHLLRERGHRVFTCAAVEIEPGAVNSRVWMAVLADTISPTSGRAGYSVRLCSERVEEDWSRSRAKVLRHQATSHAIPMGSNGVSSADLSGLVAFSDAVEEIRVALNASLSVLARTGFAAPEAESRLWFPEDGLNTAFGRADAPAGAPDTRTGRAAILGATVSAWWESMMRQGHSHETARLLLGLTLTPAECVQFDYDPETGAPVLNAPLPY
jgi:hypothetical protein